MLGFLNTTILLGLLGVGIPIAIHLLARQKLQRIDFSSIKFLKLIHHQRMQRMKLRQVLLLVLRSLAVLFLVLAFARPTLRKTAGAGPAQARSSIVLLVDRSLSMGRGNVFPKTQEKAAAVLDLVKDGDEAALLWTVSPQEIQQGFTHDAHGLRKVLAKETSSWEKGQAQQKSKQAFSLLSQSHNLNREIFLVTDLQAVEFLSPSDTASGEPPPGRLFVLAVEGDEENVGLVRAGVENQILQPRTPLRILAEVKNYGRKKVTDRLIRIFLEEEPAAQKTVTLEPGQSQSASFAVLPDRTGWVWGTVRLEEDNLPQDNEWFFVCRIPERIRVLLVGKTAPDIRPIRLTLDPRQEGNKIFEVIEAYSGENWSEQMEGADVIFFSNYPSFSLDEKTRLERFVEAGGGVFFLLGDDVDVRNYNSQFFGPVLEMDLGTDLQSRETEKAYLVFGSVDWDHPLFQNMFEKEKPDIRSPRFFQVVDIIRKTGRQIISLGNGMPLLVEQSVGQGKIFLITSGIATRWSDFPYTTIFAPLIHRSAAYLSTSSFWARQNPTVGEPISLQTGTGQEGTAAYWVETPSGEPIRVLPAVKGGKTTLTLPRTEQPGIYRFYSGETLLGIQAVNIDPLESDLRPLSEKELRSNLPKVQVRIIRDTHNLERAVAEARWGREFWREALLLAVLVLVAEMFIAREGRKNEASVASGRSTTG